MKKFLIIPRINELDESLALAEEYGFGFEYNDFFDPDTLDNENRVSELVGRYKSRALPEYCTMHGDFFDVMPGSVDRRIREISAQRVAESVSAARKMGVKGIVFHSNFNPFFTAADFITKWADDNAAFWGKVLEENADIEFYIENMFDRTPTAMRELSERLCGYDNYGVCFDYAHAALTETPHEEWLISLGKYVRHVHINDNDLISDLHLAVGEGKLDWELFYELYDRYMNGASVLIETSAVERQRASAEKLRKDGFLG